ncbi:MAG: hypothetical protein QW607_10175 [Desulfurococcaceae archaeon]
MSSFETIINRKTEKRLLQLAIIIFLIVLVYAISFTCSAITNCSNPDLVSRLFMFEKHVSRNLVAVPLVAFLLVIIWIIAYFKLRDIEKELSTINAISKIERNRLIKDYKQCLLNYLYASLLWVIIFTIISFLELTIPPIIHISLILYSMSELGVFLLAYRDLLDQLEEYLVEKE